MVSHTMCKTLKGDRKKKENDRGYYVTIPKKCFVSRMLLIKIKAVLGKNFLITNCVSSWMYLLCVLNTL